MRSPRSQRRQPTTWLILVHQLPARSSNLRVRVWRRLQAIGAMVLKHAVYVLPDSAAAREDFEWLKAEIEGAGGQAAVFAGDHIDPWSSDALVAEFRRGSEKTYGRIAHGVRQALRSVKGQAGRTAGPSPALRRRVEQFRQRAAAAAAVDFFDAPGRDTVSRLIAELETSMTPRAARDPARAAAVHDAAAYRKRLWVTRPRPGVDRMASAWLVRRFIDADARFAFVADKDAAPAGSLPFDMFGVDLTHRGGDCTFEVLCRRFDIRDRAVARLAGLVHDLDLKDGRFGAAGAETVGAVIEGLRRAHQDDHTLLEHGMTLFEALYRSFGDGVRPRPRPAPVGRSRARKGRRKR